MIIDSCGICSGGQTGNVPVFSKTDCFITEIEENEIKAMDFYPNPTTGTIHFSKNMEEGSELVIYTLAQKEVFRKTIYPQESINIEHLAVGVYLVQVNHLMKKLVISK